MAAVVPFSDPEAYVDKALLFICFRDWCQDLLAERTMLPAVYHQYKQLTQNLINDAIPYVEFRRQMVELLQNYRHLQVYWDVYHSWCSEMATTWVQIDFSLLFYPIYVCRRLNLIPAFANVIFGYPEVWNSASEWSQEQAYRLAGQPAAELERNLDFETLVRNNPHMYDYPGTGL